MKIEINIDEVAESIKGDQIIENLTQDERIC